LKRIEKKINKTSFVGIDEILKPGAVINVRHLVPWHKPNREGNFLSQSKLFGVTQTRVPLSSCRPSFQGRWQPRLQSPQIIPVGTCERVINRTSHNSLNSLVTAIMDRFGLKWCLRKLLCLLLFFRPVLKI